MSAGKLFPHEGTHNVFVSDKDTRAFDRHVEIAVVNRLYFDGNLQPALFIFAPAVAGHT